MLDLESAIKHAEEVAEKNEENANWYQGMEYSLYYKKWIKCASEHRQLAGWLKELKRLREQTRWIPVSERLPKAGEHIGDVAKYYLVQNEYGDMLVARYTHSEYWEEIYRLKPIGDEIVAWMPLPKPMTESEDEGCK